MQSENLPMALRRSSRVPAELQVRVTTLEGAHFSEVCKTLVVNAHGCALQTPVKFDAGVPLRLDSGNGRETTARVVSCQPIGPDNRAWKLGAKLDRPENFWGLVNCPGDWSLHPAPVSIGQVRIVPRTNASKAPPTDLNLESKLDLIAQRLEAPLKMLIADSIAPLEAQVAALKETIARREANPSKFEVSLSSIPPQLEQQLEDRLRKDLGPKVLQESRQQYAQLLESAKSVIDKRTNEGYDSFLNRVEDEVKAVEVRSQRASSEIEARAEQRFAQEMKEFQQKLLEGGNALKRLSEELLQFLQNNLNAEYSARREDMEKLHAAVIAESSRLRQETEGLENRIARLHESARSLESGLDKRLGQMSSNVVKDTRGQLESLATEVLDQLSVSGGKTMEHQLAEAKEKVKANRDEALVSFNESLAAETTDSLRAFDESIDQSAKQSIERWRLKLAADLNAVAKKLGDEF